MIRKFKTWRDAQKLLNKPWWRHHRLPWGWKEPEIKCGDVIDIAELGGSNGTIWDVVLPGALGEDVVSLPHNDKLNLKKVKNGL